jgi:hypothetical protein
MQYAQNVFGLGTPTYIKGFLSTILVQISELNRFTLTKYLNTHIKLVSSAVLFPTITLYLWDSNLISEIIYY